VTRLLADAARQEHRSQNRKHTADDHAPNETELSHRWRGRAHFSVFYSRVSPF
jgi:hypothetical protein